jgi:hypothetical protein
VEFESDVVSVSSPPAAQEARDPASMTAARSAERIRFVIMGNSFFRGNIGNGYTQ